MNLHDMVRGTITGVNPDLTVQLKRSTGYTTGANGTRTPTYSITDGRVQIQALSASNLQHMNNLNIQGIMRKVYMYGDWGGPVRADKTGGDLLVFPQERGGPARDWKIVTVFETWADWSAVGVVLQ